jgi:phosphatidate cytidylyltransferase
MKNNFLLRLISILILAPIVIILIFLGGYYFYMLMILIFFFSLKEVLSIKNFKIQILIISLFLLFFYSTYQISEIANGKLYLYYLLIITWLSDSGGYIFGKLFKGPKINLISPNKTYLGFLGSILFSQFTIIYINIFNLYESFNLLEKFILIFLSSLAVIFGDLLFSFFKRVSKIKDYSNILPGHGGILDRIDGMIILTVLFYLFIFLK